MVMVMYHEWTAGWAVGLRDLVLARHACLSQDLLVGAEQRRGSPTWGEAACEVVAMQSRRHAVSR